MSFSDKRLELARLSKQNRFGLGDKIAVAFSRFEFVACT